MKNYTDHSFLEIDGWKTKDTNLDIMFPWYTRPFLKYLVQIDTSDWKVFEFGGGNSTQWWRKNAREVHAVDTDLSWSSQCGLNCVTDKESFLKFPLTLIENEKFDCIIIDGEPTSWRDDCTEYALLALKDNGKLIIDNYKQPTVGLGEWPKTDKLLLEYECRIFAQPDHEDWKTAIWTKESK